MSGGQTPVDDPLYEQLAPAAVAARWTAIRERLAAVGGLDVDVVAVTKGFDRRAVAAALAIGVVDVGENYAQELLAKAASFDAGEGLRWHAIGRLQRNKVRSLAPHVHLWQTVDRRDLGVEIARWAPGAQVLVQVNISGESGKGGCAPLEAAVLVRELDDLGLDVRGLMGVGPHGPPEAARDPFRRLVAMADDFGLPVRSIGMSADMEVAVEAGATVVRIGSALFGPRPGGPR